MVIGMTVNELSSEIVQFRNFLEKRAQMENSALQYLPEEHAPLIAKLVHERYA